MLSKRNKIIAVLFLIMVSMLFYVFHFEDIEPICLKKNKDEEYFLINFWSKKELIKKVIKHNASVNFEGKEFSKIYLLNDIFELPDPVFGSVLNYKKNQCEEIDSDDVYCVIDFSKIENNKMRIFYNFIDEGKNFTIIR